MQVGRHVGDGHARRQQAASELATRISAEMHRLAMEGSQFDIVLTALEQPNAYGAESVEYHVAANAGTPLRPLAKVASGGELSRLALAIAVTTLRQGGGASTLIFDEIDRGVGGAVASAIGERLARLAGDAQLLVVTHSPQVAARGGQHLLIAKSHDGLVTRTGVRALDDDARREEIARMLGGEQITSTTRRHAKEMLVG